MNFKLYKQLYNMLNESLSDDDEDIVVHKVAKAENITDNITNKFIRERILVSNDSELSDKEKTAIEIFKNAGKNNIKIDSINVKVDNIILLKTYLLRASSYFKDPTTGIDEALYNWLDTSALTSLLGVFKNNIKFNGDITSWDVSNVINMNEAFAGARSFNRNLSNWNIDKVKFMAHAFYGTPKEFQMMMRAKVLDKAQRAKEDSSVNKIISMGQPFDLK